MATSDIAIFRMRLRFPVAFVSCFSKKIFCMLHHVFQLQNRMPGGLNPTEMPVQKRWLTHCKNDCGQHLAQAILPILNTVLRDINIRLCNSERLFWGSNTGMKTKADSKEIYLVEWAGKGLPSCATFQNPHGQLDNRI